MIALTTNEQPSGTDIDTMAPYTDTSPL